jgi:hypothetical protein
MRRTWILRIGRCKVRRLVVCFVCKSKLFWAAANESISRPVLSQKMEDEMFGLIMQPASTCPYLEPSSSRSDECREFLNQRLRLQSNLSRNYSIGSRLTPGLLSRVQDATASCWVGCSMLLSIRAYLAVTVGQIFVK